MERSINNLFVLNFERSDRRTVIKGVLYLNKFREWSIDVLLNEEEITLHEGITAERERAKESISFS